jgi:hypothetical protein
MENCSQVVEQLHSDGGEGATVFRALFPPCVAHHRDLFSQGDDTLYEKGRAWRIVALFILVLINRRLQKTDQVIEHPDYRCVSETVRLDHRFVALFWAQEEYVVQVK